MVSCMYVCVCVSKSNMGYVCACVFACACLHVCMFLNQVWHMCTRLSACSRTRVRVEDVFFRLEDVKNGIFDLDHSFVSAPALGPKHWSDATTSRFLQNKCCSD